MATNGKIYTGYAIRYGIYESSEYMYVAAAMVNPVTIKSSLHSYQTTLSRVIAAIYTIDIINYMITDLANANIMVHTLFNSAFIKHK